MAFLGIDLGTSNSAAALVRRREKGEVLALSMVQAPEGRADGADIFPSYVAFDRDGNFSAAGLRAKERYRDGATDLVVRHFKRLIGRTYDHVAGEISRGNPVFQEFKDRLARGPRGEILIQVGPQRYSVVEVAALLLGKIKEVAAAEAHRLWVEEIEGVTVSIPAGYDGPQREATKAAANAAGFTNIKVIEEPTAAAIARGVEGSEGHIMVVDMGAGTTDIVVGHIVKDNKGLRMLMSCRKCDDLLGGMDMDNRIRDKYVMDRDRNPPPLADIYPGMDLVEKNRLMAGIELAKINASLDGNGYIAMTLRVEDKGKRLGLPLNEETLNEIVHPLVSGFRPDPDSDCLKGLKPLVDEVLLDLANNDPCKVDQTKSQIHHLILVGGPCRMRLIHRELAGIFAGNDAICQMLQGVDPLDSFFMDGVARGAALSSSVEYDTQTPYPISVFHWHRGKTPIIPQGAPYHHEEGISRTALVPVHKGLNSLYIVSEKDGAPPNWTMRSHMIHVPEDGKIQLTLHWSEGGTDMGKSSIGGAGLPRKINFPEVREGTSLGTSLSGAFKRFLEASTVLRDITGRSELREKIKASIRKVTGTKGTPLPPGTVDTLCDSILIVDEEDLKKCEAIDPEAQSKLSEKEVKTAFQEGYFKPRDSDWADRCGLSPRAVEVLNIYFDMDSQNSGSLEEVMEVSRLVLSQGPFLPQCSDFIQQLKDHLTETEKQLHNSKLGYALADALLAAVECLHQRDGLDNETYKYAIYVFHKFNPED